MPLPSGQILLLTVPLCARRVRDGRHNLTATRTTAPFGQGYDPVDQAYEGDPSFPSIGCCVMKGLQIATC